MGTEEPQLPPEGWYDDPDGRGDVKRYWDGRNWTQRYHGAPGSGASAVERIDRRFRSLHLVATVFHVLGWITIVVGIPAVIVLAIEVGDEQSSSGLFVNGREADSGASALGVIVFGGLGVLLYALLSFAAAAFIRLMLVVEHSTHRTAEAVERLVEAGS